MKKIVSVVLCLVLVFSLSSVAFAKSVSFKSFFPNFYDKIAEYDQGDQNYEIPVYFNANATEGQKTHIKNFLSEYTKKEATYIIRFTESNAFYI